MGVAAMTLNPGEYAIHGTNAPNSIGHYASYGCIRMHNADIMDLYQRVDVGALVMVCDDLGAPERIRTPLGGRIEHQRHEQDQAGVAVGAKYPQARFRIVDVDANDLPGEMRRERRAARARTPAPAWAA